MCVCARVCVYVCAREACWELSSAISHPSDRVCVRECVCVCVCVYEHVNVCGLSIFRLKIDALPCHLLHSSPGPHTLPLPSSGRVLLSSLRNTAMGKQTLYKPCSLSHRQCRLVSPVSPHRIRRAITSYRCSTDSSG